MIQIWAGLVLVIIGCLVTWLSLRGLVKTRVKPRQRVDASVFAVMELQAQEYRVRYAPPSLIQRGRKETLNFEPSPKEREGTLSTGLFGEVSKSAPDSEDLSPPALHIGSTERKDEEETKTLGL